MKTTIYLVRHAEAEGNLCRRMHGQYNSNLTARGLRQLVDLQRRFEQIPVDACYSSDLVRAANTAMAICTPHGLEYRVDPGFREVCIGIWEDVSFGYLNTFHGLKMIQFGRDQVNWVVEGSETYQQYTTRFLESMESAALRHEGGSIAIVSHSIVMKAVLKELFPDERIPHSANTAVSCLEYEDGKYSMVYLNDSSHMDASLYTSSRQKWWQQPGAQREDTFWFREGWTDVGIDAPHSPIVLTVMEDQKPVGLICMTEESDEDGVVDFLGLIPEYRGHDLSIQLFGKAISVMRARGKSWLTVRMMTDNYVHKLCTKLVCVPLSETEAKIDLRLQIRPYGHLA